MKTRIKICGLTRFEDARRAAELGADYLGLIFAPGSRQVRVQDVRDWLPALRAEFPGCAVVGVFLRPGPDEITRVAEAVGLDLVQIHGWDPEGPDGSETAAMSWPRPCIRALPAERLEAEANAPRSSSDGPWAFLADSTGPGGAGGTGLPFDWSVLSSWQRPEGLRLFVAGGLCAENVAGAVSALRPFAVDASSRLEEAPGRKDAGKMERFIRQVRAADEQAVSGPTDPEDTP